MVFIAGAAITDQCGNAVGSNAELDGSTPRRRHFATFRQGLLREHHRAGQSSLRHLENPRATQTNSVAVVGGGDS
jgi:hypothetical protein